MPQKQISSKNSIGFTLIELLVVLAVIGILSGIVLVSLSAGRDKAKIAKAQSEVRQIHLAIFGLEGNAGQWPGHKTTYRIEQTDDNEICPDGCAYGLNDCRAGILCDDFADPYPNWKGPYYPESLIDPWGNEYFFDTDYDIGEGVTKWAVVIGSYGPNGVGNNLYDDDDIIFVIPSR